MTTTTTEAAIRETQEQEPRQEMGDLGAELIGQVFLWLMPALAVLFVLLQR